jgi:hypothetical protein
MVCESFCLRTVRIQLSIIDILRKQNASDTWSRSSHYRIYSIVELISRAKDLP